MRAIKGTSKKDEKPFNRGLPFEIAEVTNAAAISDEPSIDSIVGGSDVDPARKYKVRCRMQ